VRVCDGGSWANSFQCSTLRLRIRRKTHIGRTRNAAQGIEPHQTCGAPRRRILPNTQASCVPDGDPPGLPPVGPPAGMDRADRYPCPVTANGAALSEQSKAAPSEHVLSIPRCAMIVLPTSLMET